MPEQNRITDTAGDSTHAGTSDDDIFEFAPDNGADTITGFANGSDRIDLSAFPEIRDFSDLTVTSDAQGVTIDLSAHGGGTIFLQGFSIDDLDAGDFIFADWQIGNDWLEIIRGDGSVVNIDARGGDDVVFGSDADERIRGGQGKDTIKGGGGRDTIFGGADDDWIRGDEGDDTLYGGTGADTFVFRYGHGNDTIKDFSPGEDLIDLRDFVGGISSFSDLTITADGNDAVIDLSAHGGGTIRLENVAVSDLTAGDFVLEIVGTDSGETITGGASHDFIYGKDGADTIEGGAGNDHIEGGAGDDTIRGGEGDDSLVGDDYLGAEGDDTIYGEAGNDTIEGGAGRDTLYGGADADKLYGGAGNDTLYGGEGDDWLQGGDGDDELHGGAGADTLLGGAGNDTLYGGIGAHQDLLYGGEDNDTLHGGEGDDWLDGGAGADTFVFAPGHGNDTVADFTAGEDVIDLSAITGITGFEDLTFTTERGYVVIDLSAHGGGKITLRGVTENNLDADDFVFYQNVHTGTDAAENLAGGAGHDTITGLGGDDTLTGNAGADTFVFASGHGDDTVADFTDGEDTIDLSAFTGITGFSDLTATQNGADVVIDLSSQGGGEITLQNFTLSDLDATDFAFYVAPVGGDMTDSL